MKVGDPVRHTDCPDDGVGVLTALYDDGTCDARFEGGEYSGIPVTTVATVEMVTPLEEADGQEHDSDETVVAPIELNGSREESEIEPRDAPGEPGCTEEWDDDQLVVIQAEPDDRLLVDAGPGTGKTAVACARLAYLINEEDVEAGKTWMISFTRAAVAEIRSRLHAHVGDASYAIHVATIDSHAWSIHSGHVPNASLAGSYEKNIERVIELVRTDEGVTDELDEIEHVVIDEAQDIVGVRAELIQAMIERLPDDCGVTLFADEAQAIYGFADDIAGTGGEESAEQSVSLLERMQDGNMPGFETLALKEVHRTSSPGLRQIFSEVRSKILEEQSMHAGLHGEIAGAIRELADEGGVRLEQMDTANADIGTLILCRRRAEALSVAHACDLPCSLRLSGYGATLPSWLALCFRDYDRPTLGRRQFSKLWSERVDGKVSIAYGSDTAWERLLRVGGTGGGAVDMRRLRGRLSRSRPPVELANADYGLPGAIFGTIHASKGREADHVVLFLPGSNGFSKLESEAEETRVLFVGATRARTTLMVGDGLPWSSRTLDSGRIFGWTADYKTRLEIGRDGDVSPTSLLGRECLGPKDAVSAQEFLEDRIDAVTGYSLAVDPDLDWRYRIVSEEGSVCVGVLTERVNHDLWALLRKRGKDGSRRPPTRLDGLRGQGCRTVVVSPDDSECQDLHTPWNSSGFMLAPTIVGYPAFYFPKR